MSEQRLEAKVGDLSLMSDDELMAEKARLEKLQLADPVFNSEIKQWVSPWNGEMAQRLDAIEQILIQRKKLEPFKQKPVGFPNLDKGIQSAIIFQARI